MTPPPYDPRLPILDRLQALRLLIDAARKAKS